MGQIWFDEPSPADRVGQAPSRRYLRWMAWWSSLSADRRLWHRKHTYRAMR